MENEEPVTEAINISVNLKTIQEIIDEIKEINHTTLDKLEIINHVGTVGTITSKSGDIMQSSPSGLIQTICDELNAIRKQSSEISKETNLLIGN